MASARSVMNRSGIRVIPAAAIAGHGPKKKVVYNKKKMENNRRTKDIYTIYVYIINSEKLVNIYRRNESAR